MKTSFKEGSHVPLYIKSLDAMEEGKLYIRDIKGSITYFIANSDNRHRGKYLVGIDGYYNVFYVKDTDEFFRLYTLTLAPKGTTITLEQE